MTRQPHTLSLMWLRTQATHPEHAQIREYTVKPEGLHAYLRMLEGVADTRKQLLPFLGMFLTDLGGPLTKLTHLYHYQDYNERDKLRAAAYKNEACECPGSVSRMRHVSSQCGM